MISLQEFKNDLIENIQLDSVSKSIPQEIAYFEKTTNTLAQVGDLDKEIYSGYNSEFAFFGFAYRTDTKTLQLISIIYTQDELRNLQKSEIENVFKKLQKVIPFISKKNYIKNKIEETSEFYDCCMEISNLLYKDEVNEIQLILITDANLPKSMYQIDSNEIQGINYTYSVFDINYFYQIFKNGNQYASFIVETNLPFLKINNSNNDYISYLTVINGKDLASIYGKYKSKLLEENVRTFLQFRGDVNKGIKNTLQNKPDYFFAYNNGITATATEVEIENNCIIKINNLQIVNGGQTTASIYTASEKYKLDLTEVNVPMKLSVVLKQDIHSSFVSDVAEFANTQNKVNKSDFFSNHKFHLDMKNMSSRLWVNRKGGAQVRSRWYYERVRGEYLNEQSHLNKTYLDKFLLEYPKNQFIDKLDLAKSENAWIQRPYFSALGAQGSFIKFSEYIIEATEANENLVTEYYFKSAIAKLIIFKGLENLISSASWYSNGFRAQTVAYSLAALSHIIEKNYSKHFNFEIIWELQSIPDNLLIELKKIARAVHLKLISPNSTNGNVSVYAKKKECWESMKRLNFDDVFIGDSFLLSKDEFKDLKRGQEKGKKFTDEIDKEIFIFKINYKTWARLLEFNLDENLSEFQIRTLKKYSVPNTHLLTKNETNALYKLLKDAEKIGFEYSTT